MSENKESRRQLTTEEMDQVTGGTNRTVNTGNRLLGTDRPQGGPGKGYGQLTSLVNGTNVNTIGDPVWDDVSGRHFVEIEFYDRNGVFRTGWIATSLIGMKR